MCIFDRSGVTDEETSEVYTVPEAVVRIELSIEISIV